MRKKEKEVTDPAALGALLDRAPWGTLGLLAPDGQPLLVPISFVHQEGRIYFHSAPVGEKMEAIRANPEATFLVADLLAKIPSFVFDPVNANAGFTFFKSVILRGRIALVTDPERKAGILQALVDKYQPEGRCEPITADSPTYRAVVKGLAILELTVARRSGKFSLGQALKPEGRAVIRRFLEERGRPDDLRTLEAMAACPGPARSE